MKGPATVRKKSGTPSMPLENCLAKTWSCNTSRGVPVIHPGRTVEDHGRIAMAVALRLLELMPERERALFPRHAGLACGMHDVGKIWPVFQRKLHAAAGTLGLWPQLKDAPCELEGGLGYHYTVSRAAMQRISGSSSLADVVGWHHGVMPKTGREAEDIRFGGPAWEAMREEYARRMNPGGEWPVPADSVQADLLKGLVTVSDWIASGEIFDDPAEPWEPLVDRAVADAGFGRLEVVCGLSFRDVFGRDPYNMQIMFAEQVAVGGSDCSGTGGVHVLEAPMGMGKTEAALYAAYLLLADGRASGIYFALPTRLTSDKIHDRMHGFLNRISAGSTPRLLHGRARLLGALGTLGADAAPGGDWFGTAKRGLLAPFAVGTVDQALLSVLAVKHAFVRECGLAGKVVILDEVHSYDDYTGTLIDELVGQLRRTGCTVIILSATLTRERRASLLGVATSGMAYPLASSSCSGVIREVECPAPPDSEFRIRSNASEDEAFEEALRRAGEGQQVLWIENTVDAAQSAYFRFAARTAAMGAEAGLLHSRFTPADRARNEERWTSLYASGRQKPENNVFTGRVLVGTQVLEQSLDIDSDFLVSRFCPSDMLFQRLGRLWRGASTARPGGAVREAWLLAPELDDALAAPDRAFGVSGVVYRPYVLARSLEVWNERTSVRLPSEIRPLMEEVYRFRPEEDEPTDAMRRVRADLEKERVEYRCKALAGMDASRGLHPEDAKTRLDERPSSDVLLLKAWDAARGRAVGLDGTVIDVRGAGTAAARARAAALLEENLLNFSTTNKFEKNTCVSRQSAEVLSRCLHSAGGDEPSLRLFLVQDDESLRDEGGRDVRASYAPDTGLVIERGR